MVLQAIASTEIWSVVSVHTIRVLMLCNKARAMVIEKTNAPGHLWIQPATPEHIRRYEDQKRKALNQAEGTGETNSGL